MDRNGSDSRINQARINQVKIKHQIRGDAISKVSVNKTTAVATRTGSSISKISLHQDSVAIAASVFIKVVERLALLRTKCVENVRELATMLDAAFHQPINKEVVHLSVRPLINSSNVSHAIKAVEQGLILSLINRKTNWKWETVTTSCLSR